MNCKVNLNLKAMGLKTATAKNALDERLLLLKDGVLSAGVRPASLVLLWVE